MVWTERLQSYQGGGELHGRSGIELFVGGLRRDCCSLNRFRQNALNAGDRCQISRLGYWGRRLTIHRRTWEWRRGTIHFRLRARCRGRLGKSNSTGEKVRRDDQDSIAKK